MKFTAAANLNSLNSYQGISLSSKTLAATYSDSFSLKYNSPKNIPAKGFALPKHANDNPTLLISKPHKNDSYLGQTKSKGGRSQAGTPGNSTPSQKMLSSTTTQGFGNRDEKKSSGVKQKTESQRTMSSTPKNSSSSKSSDPSKRKEDASYSLEQFKWKKLEISTEFNNTKASFANKAHTTKNTELNETSAKDLNAKAVIQQYSIQNLAKSLQNTNNYNFYTQQNLNDHKAKDQKSKAIKAVPNPEIEPKTTSAKENVKVNNFFKSEKESSASRPSYKNATSKTSQTLPNNEDDIQITITDSKKASNNGQFDLRYSYQGNTGETTKKKRPVSAKKEEKEPKEEQTPTQKVSLQTFVTRINKGDMFTGLKKEGERRDGSIRRNQPKLNIEEKSSKPVKAIDLGFKGAKTTPNTEAKTLTLTLNKASVQSSSQMSGQKSSKNTKYSGLASKEAIKPTQEVSLRNRNPGKEPFIYYMSNLEKAHTWSGDADYFIQVYREHFIQSFQALSFCRYLKPADNATIIQKKVNLPKRDPSKEKKTLVFDMDETLIHCNESTDMPADVILPITFPHGEIIEAGINVRPYALECLRELSEYYEIIVFTASHACYANVVLDYLDPNEQYIQQRLFRDSCVVTDEGVHIKDLRVIGNRNLQDVILVDNAAYSFAFQIENGVPIIPFYDNKADQELRHLIPYLKFLSSVKDVRDINKQTFKLHQYSSFDSPEDVLDKVIL
jgi:CTD small phosphatase-like protein 2